MNALGPQVGAFRPSARGMLPICVLPAVATAPMVVRNILIADEMTLLGGIALVLVIPAAVGLMLLLLLPLRRVFEVRVYELGLSGHDLVGCRIELLWSQISGGASHWLLGLTYLRLESSDPKRTLWLPCFLSERPAFDRLVARHAGSGHPLVLALAETRAGAPGA